MGAEWTVELVDSGSSLSVASTQFTVLQSLTLNVTSGPSGTIVSIVATGLQSGTPTIGDNLAATFNGTTVTLNSAMSSGWGDFNATFTVPLSALGNWTLRITDDTGDDITATFQVTGYTITVNQNSHGTISPATQEYTKDTNQTYTITPDLGYHIVDVVVDSVSKGAVSSWQFNNVTENHSITATYALDEYTITILTSGNGSVVKTPSHLTYHYGDLVELTATPDAGYSFSAWTGDTTGTNTTITVTMNGNKTVTATFTQNKYTITLNYDGQGHINCNATEPYTYNQAVNLTAIADQGWTFAGWSNDASGSNNPYTLVMDSNKTVTATFVHNTYYITINTIGQGSVNRNVTGPYEYSQDVNLTAVAAAGWCFSGWSGDASGNDNPYIVSIDSNITITATFTQDSYLLTVITVGQGSVAAGNVTYLSGTNVTLEALSTAGWCFSDWTGDITGTANLASVVMDRNMTVTATFKRNTYILTVITIGNGVVRPANESFKYGEKVDVGAKNDDGWSFSGWSGNASGANPKLRLTMTGNLTITATFTENVYTLTLLTVGNGDVLPGNMTAYSYNDSVRFSRRSTLKAGHSQTGQAT